MDQRKRTLFDALKLGATQPGRATALPPRQAARPVSQPNTSRERRDRRRQAVKDGLLEVTRVETAGKATIEWVRVTPKGQAFLGDSESPLRALEELRDALAVHQQGLPAWAAQMNARIDDAMARGFIGEIEAMRRRLGSYWRGNVEAAIGRIEAIRAEADLPETPWGPELWTCLERRQASRTGHTCCPLADLFAALKEKNAGAHGQGIPRGPECLQDRNLIALLARLGNGGDTPWPRIRPARRPGGFFITPAEPIRRARSLRAKAGRAVPMHPPPGSPPEHASRVPYEQTALADWLHSPYTWEVMNRSRLLESHFGFAEVPMKKGLLAVFAGIALVSSASRRRLAPVPRAGPDRRLQGKGPAQGLAQGRRPEARLDLQGRRPGVLHRCRRQRGRLHARHRFYDTTCRRVGVRS